MIWLVLRRQRTALLLAGGLIATLAVVLVVARLTSLTEWSGAVLLCDSNGLPCTFDETTVLPAAEINLHRVITAALFGAPALVGILTGAGLFGRELDHGTHVLALTQSIGRMRWWLTGLLVCGIPATAAIGLLTVMATWALAPITLLAPPLETPGFETSGIAPMMYTLLAFVVSATAGLLLRSTLSAVVVAAAVQAAVLAVLIVGDVRFHYLPAETTLTMLDPGADGIETSPRTVVVAGSQATKAAEETRYRVDVLDRSGRPLPQTYLDNCASQTYQTLPGCLAAEGGVEVRTTYQPLTRYWSFQAIESGLVAALAAGVLALGHAGLRRRRHQRKVSRRGSGRIVEG